MLHAPIDEAPHAYDIFCEKRESCTMVVLRPMSHDSTKKGHTAGPERAGKPLDRERAHAPACLPGCRVRRGERRRPRGTCSRAVDRVRVWRLAVRASREGSCARRGASACCLGARLPCRDGVAVGYATLLRSRARDMGCATCRVGERRGLGAADRRRRVGARRVGADRSRSAGQPRCVCVHASHDAIVRIGGVRCGWALRLGSPWRGWS